MLEHLAGAAAALGEFDAYVPCSALTGEGVDGLVDELEARLPEGPHYFPDGVVTDQPETFLAAELVREQLLRVTHDELPHSIAVLVEEMLPAPDRPADKPLLRIFADIYVERQSQKAIVIGLGGARLRDIGTRSRAGIESLLGTKVYLDLHVRVAKEWQRDPKQLRRLGF